MSEGIILTFIKMYSSRSVDMEYNLDQRELLKLNEENRSLKNIERVFFCHFIKL